MWQSDHQGPAPTDTDSFLLPLLDFLTHAPMKANTTAAAAETVPAKPRSGWKKGV
jgi:hypothetical protein